ncbi:MAG: HNH endonuclease [Pseudomonadota bacterium]|nr:HNH endonuclease [Pseudomonadota bacterium]
MGRRTRTIPPAIRRALNTRDPGCCFPGCTYRCHLDAHHIEHWADGGATKLSNLISLCRRHHRLVHEGGIAVEARASGGWRFRRPDGREFEMHYREQAPTYGWTALQETHAAQGIPIDDDTAATRWAGERMDYELGVWTLCGQEQRARLRPSAGAQANSSRNVSAETFLG